MLKPRLVAALIIRGGIVVQSLGFRAYRPIGRPQIVIDYLNRFGIDEIVMLDIDASAAGKGPDLDSITRASAKCFVPLAAGGGIRSVADMTRAIRCGADKVAINTAALGDPGLIEQGAAVFGSQCIVVSMDVKRHPDGALEVYRHGGREPAGRSPIDWSREAARRGAGEIFINSVDRDGARQGYDLDLIRRVAEAVDIPVIACGGAGHPRHIREVIDAGASAAAAGNMLHFTEHSVITAKAYLKAADVDVRLDSYANYSHFGFDPAGRIEKQDESYLDHQRFVHYPKEVI